MAATGARVTAPSDGLLSAVEQRYAVDRGERPGAEGLRQLRSLNVDRLPAAWRARVERDRGEALELLAAAAEREPLEGGLHGDLFPGNVLVHDGAAVGLIDWEEPHVGWLAGELGNAMWECCRDPSGDDLDRAAAERFVRAYRAAGGPVPAAEDGPLLPLLRARRLLEVLRAPTDRHVDWGYHWRNVQVFEHLG
jgi:Ser/Thr protein kinase RdoA (MazF antagonist)